VLRGGKHAAAQLQWVHHKGFTQMSAMLRDCHFDGMRPSHVQAKNTDANDKPANIPSHPSREYAGFIVALHYDNHPLNPRYPDSMRILSYSAATALFIAAGSAASAQTVIHIAGATTYRAPVHKAILDCLDAGYTYAYDESSGNLYKAGSAIFKGTLNVSGHPSVIVKTYWTGSLAGVVDLCQQNNLTQWLANGVTTSASGSNLNGTTYLKETAPCQVAMTDSYQSSIAASVATAVGGDTIADKINNATLSDAGGANANAAGTVGIVPFEWVLGKTSAGTAAFTNVTQQLALALTQGPVPVASFTGNVADKLKYAFLIGRNEDSGTRIGALAEAQSGFGQSVVQYQLSFSNNQKSQSDGLATGGTNSTVTGLYLWPSNAPLNTNSSVNWNTAGHSGYIGGGDVGNVLNATNPTTGLTVGSVSNPTPTPTGLTNAYFVGYMGIADAKSTVGTTELSYNGVPYSVAAVQSGQYTFWSFEHMYYISGGASALTGTAKTTANTIADKIFTADAPTNSSGVTLAGQVNAAGVLYDSNFLVTRQVEGGQVSQNY
jgi:hypothetical protein